MPNDKLIPFEIPMNGKLITAYDPATIGNNFRELINLKPKGAGKSGIAGMTKINTTVLADAYKHMQNGFHYKKEQPAESHVLIQAANTSDASTVVIENTTAIPSQGDFSATVLATDSSGAGIGRFSDAPRGDVAYCNGVDTMIWGGDEKRIDRFVDYNPSGAYKYNYTKYVQNTLADSNNIATLHSVAAAIDANTKLLLHLDTDFTDSSGNSNTFTAVGNAAIATTAPLKFGAGYASLDGTGDWLTRANDADLDASGGTITIEAWIYTDLTQAGCIWSHAFETGTLDYISFEHDTNGALHYKIFHTTQTDFAVSTANSVITANTWTHVAVVESGDNHYLYVGGILKATGSTSNRPGTDNTLNSAHYIGATYNGTATSNPFKGRIEEFRFSDAARWTSDFEVETVAYGSTTTHYHYVGSTRPLKGIKYYIGTGNNTAGTLAIYEWTGTGWSAVSSLVDGTLDVLTSTKPLNVTGSITFTSTVTTSKLRAIDSIILYWYRVTLTSLVDSSTTITQITLDAPFQQIPDIWDGALREVSSFQVYDNSTYNDKTPNVFEDSVDSSNTYTYAELDSLGATTDYCVAGFIERLMGVEVHLVGGSVNTTANTVLSVKYSSDGNTWTSVSGLVDGTSENNISFAKSGVISWNPPNEIAEFERTISNELPLYYYQLVFNQALSGDVKLYFVGGITAQKSIKGWKFPFYADNSLFLCSNKDDEKNAVIKSQTGTSHVFNGNDFVKWNFGDDTEVVAAATLYSQRGSSIFNIKVFFKKNSMYGLIGNGLDSYIDYPIDPTIGITAPLTLKNAVINLDGVRVPVLIWRASDGIYVFNNTSPKVVSTDIENFFDKNETSTRRVHPDYIANDVAYISKELNAYVWCFADGSSTDGTLNRELALDLDTMEWYEISRGTGNLLQCAFEVTSTTGNEYAYGCLDSGYMERLNYGTNFDGTAIAQSFHFGDMSLDKDKSINFLIKVRYFKIITIAKTTTSNSITLTHYGDSSTSGTSWTVSPQNSGKRCAYPIKSDNLGDHYLHSFKGSLSTNDETSGFEVLYCSGFYKYEREHTQ